MGSLFVECLACHSDIKASRTVLKPDIHPCKDHVTLFFSNPQWGSDIWLPTNIIKPTEITICHLKAGESIFPGNILSKTHAECYSAFTSWASWSNLSSFFFFKHFVLQIGSFLSLFSVYKCIICSLAHAFPRQVSAWIWFHSSNRAYSHRPGLGNPAWRNYLSPRASHVCFDYNAG